MAKETFADRLKYVMEKKGKKQVDLIRLAEEQGVKLGKSQVSQYVSGKTVPRTDILRFLADALDVEADWLGGREPADVQDAPQEKNDAPERLEHQEKLFKLSEKEKEQETAGETPAGETEAVGEHKEVGFIAVSAGDGLAEIFRGLGVDSIIEGGQTMNPSTEDVVNAIQKVNADTVYVLPNNKNIILAANQAKYLVEDKNVVVVPTKTIPQGITAVINYVPDMGAEENEASMTEEISHVRTGEVTYAVRDTVIDDKQIRQGDYMGIGDDGILAVGSDISDVAYDMTAAMMSEDCELISIYYGADITEEDAEKLRARVEERYPSCDIELQYGGQPIYYYIISAE